MQSIKGKVAIVTGASSGIGRGVAEELAKAGVVTVLAARSADKLQELAAEIAAEGGTAFVVPTDVTNEDDLLRLFSETERLAGPVDILVNNAGMADATPLPDLSTERWQQMLATNLTSAVICAREAMRSMKGRGGRIINMGSLSAKIPRHHSPAYTMTKFAIEGLTRQICLDGRDDNITASTLHPGATRSMLAPGSTDKLTENCLEPEMLGELVVYMCSLPPELTMLDTVILPVKNPFLGRG
ncbi:SDR family oxidoreductase [Oricola sp.]|uniref:SDR family NAD(P)-dependent oxidoreductase n=1 Tax=Oricola sp. TaxID=1979950 RepID=UPI0025E7D16E|nr:SDR family oxidoreductase [Oricola sp.]MCI5073857.1 SDR family oxidoreductase [Oricola sp.]